MNKILEKSFIKDMCEMTYNLWNKGWGENHAGNISYLLEETDIEESIEADKIRYNYPIGFDVPNLAGRLFLVTGAGESFRNVRKNPEKSLGIIKIDNTGKKYAIIWGFNDGGRPTSEFSSHLLSHEIRLKEDSRHKIILHTHSTAIIAMTFIHKLDEKEFTRTLWKMITECIMTFPDGVAVLPWMVAGTNELGLKTAQKMKESRIVIWPQHGIMSAGSDFDDAYGLIETAEKAAEIYLLASAAKGSEWNTITDEELDNLCDAFEITPKAGYLNLN